MNFKLYSILSALIILATLSSCDKDDDPVTGNGYEVNEIVKGAVLHGTNGLNFGPNGNLYVASFLGQEIVEMNKQDGSIIKRIGRDMGVNSPDDLVIGPDGSLYWTDLMLGQVVRMTPEGVVTRQYVAPGVNPITFSDDGRLFVALDFQGDGIYELDPNLINPARAIVPNVPGVFPIGFLNAFDFGPDGLLYGPIFTQGFVAKVNVGQPNDPPSSDPYNDGTIIPFAFGFKNPVAVKFNPAGVLHVLDQTGEVFTVDIVTGVKTLFVTLQEGLDNLAFDANGTMYVSNADFGWIIEVQPGGQTRTISGGGMINPGGIAVIPGSNNQDALFEADLFRLREFNGLNGQEVNVDKGHLIAQPGDLTVPFTVSADGNNLVATSWFGGKVQVWNPQTNEVVEEHTFPVPINAIRFKNDLAVVDLGIGGVVLASDPFTVILPIATSSGMATNGELLWVADWLNGDIWEISFVGNTPTSVIVATGLSFPEGLALDTDGSLVVVETGASRLSRINVSNGERTTIADGLSLGLPALEGPFPPTWTFDGVAIGQSGDIYVSGFGKNVIYRVSKK
jgi:sugar lactone lactonase YvrE